MTTTLRPTEPLQREADGALSRRYKVCVNSRPVGAIHLATHPAFGPSVAQIREVGIDEPDRRRGRATVAALAAEEVARGWGCRRIEISVPVRAEAALRLVRALGYDTRNRSMEKALGDTPPELPAGSHGRPMTETEYDRWLVHSREAYARSLVEWGVPEAEAYAKSERDRGRLLPDGLATDGTVLSVLEHGGSVVGTLWLSLRDEHAVVIDVETDEAYRGRGHGRTLMLLAEAQTIVAGRNRVALNIFAGNTPAERLYESLGYETTTYHLYKNLL
ncbi:GNAT family N-acetyltransferase [Streptomyces sp. HC44]|uniref:GNAT family N-acetyltransferase n=1 Tax=Streptomyces scabichelini TaxID=2711217 RepID=A0A6G4VK16_9ACTN|nr:GNAT family N-acetyltransferase [Streptomyces scabichelini]NGO14436.1 GNAT family N-acetyltransferase [Streptomyces scabichelini]